MSDERQGDDWWMASDGKWYPPTSVPSPPAPPQATVSAAPDDAEAANKKTKPGCAVALLLLFLVIGGCAAYVAIAGGDDDKGDASAKLACSEFRSTAREQSAGHLTYGELRDRIKKINDRAWVSETPGIASAAGDMLTAVTAGDDEALADAVNRMGTACRGIDL